MAVIRVTLLRSARPLADTPLACPGAQAPMQFIICPTRALVPTAVNAGAIGVLISGAVLVAAAEIAGHRATMTALPTASKTARE